MKPYARTLPLLFLWSALSPLWAGTLTWTPRRFDVYWIETRSDLLSGDWTPERLATQPEDAPTVTADNLPQAPAGGTLFYRVRRVD